MLAALLVIGLEVWRAYGKTVAIVAGAILIPVALAFTRLSELDAEEESAANRFDAWYEGLQLLFQKPIFGIGWGNFSDYNFGLTAHNSLVLAMTELGLVGYTVWFSFVALTGWMIYRLVFPARIVVATPTVRRAAVPSASASNPSVVPMGMGSRGVLALAEQFSPSGRSVGRGGAVGAEPRGATSMLAADQELERLAAMFVLFAVSGFALAAFFLSQSYKAMIFLNCGLVVGRYLGMREAGMPVPTNMLGMKLPLMFGLALVSVIALWALVKVLL